MHSHSRYLRDQRDGDLPDTSGASKLNRTDMYYGDGSEISKEDLEDDMYWILAIGGVGIVVGRAGVGNYYVDVHRVHVPELPRAAGMRNVRKCERAVGVSSRVVLLRAAGGPISRCLMSDLRHDLSVWVRARAGACARGCHGRCGGACVAS